MNKSTPMVNRLIKYLEAQNELSSVLGLNRKQAIIIGLCLHSEYTKRKVLALLKAVSCDTKTTKVRERDNSIQGGGMMTGRFDLTPTDSTMFKPVVTDQNSLFREMDDNKMMSKS